MLLLRPALIVLLSCVLVVGELGQSTAKAQSMLPEHLRLPQLGETARSAISHSEETRIGQRILRHYRERGRLLSDALLDEYLLSLTQQLLVHARPIGHDYRLYWIRDSAINAFAAPGGIIGVNMGLILAAENEDELASVLAHEIAHLTQRHIARQVEAARQISAATIGAALAGAALAAADPSLGAAVLSGGMAFGTQQRLNYTRAFEREADRVGQRLLAQAGFDPEAMSRFFARLLLKQLGAQRVPEYLRTHPRTEARLDDSTSIKPSTQQRTALSRNVLDFAMARARTRVLMASNKGQLAKWFQARLEQGTLLQRTEQRYGLALALILSGQARQAESMVQTLRRQNPDYLPWRLLEAQWLQAMSLSDVALQRYASMRTLYGEDVRLVLAESEALLLADRAEQARRRLQPLLNRRHSPQLYALHARACAESGLQAQSHASLAEHHYLMGNPDQALQHIMLGLRSNDASPFLQAQLRARMRLMEQLLEEQED